MAQSAQSHAVNADELLLQPWPVKCCQCGKRIGDAPLVAVACGSVPHICPDCMRKFLEACDKPANGAVISFNGWKLITAKSDLENST